MIEDKYLASADFADHRFAPYTTAIGQCALAWNYLHETLFHAFNQTVWPPANSARIWYSTNYDRPRREMLKATLLDPQKVDGQDVLAPKMVEELCWVLSETEKLEYARNTILHAPLMYLGDEITKAVKFVKLRSGVSPDFFGVNPQAVRLAKKQDILNEYHWFRDSCATLATYTMDIVMVLRMEQPPLLERPRLPNRGQKNARPDHSRRSDT